MASGPWIDEENGLIVADYFAMLADDIAGRRCSKDGHRRALPPLLNDRSEGSVEFKHQNISAVPKRLGEDRIPGYKPARNLQMTLVDAVAGAASGLAGPVAGHAAARVATLGAVGVEIAQNFLAETQTAILPLVSYLDMLRRGTRRHRCHDLRPAG